MTVPATAPSKVKDLQTVLAAMAAWVAAGSVADDIWWPEMPGDTVLAANPIAVITEEDSRTMMLVLHADAASYSEAKLSQLTTDLRDQLPTRNRLVGTGLFIAIEPEISEPQEPNDGAIAAAGKEVISQSMTLTVGIDQGA